MSDAANNLAGALEALRHMPRGVYLSFAGTRRGPSLVHLGTRVRKAAASGTAFMSSGRPTVAVVDGLFRVHSQGPVHQGQYGAFGGVESHITTRCSRASWGA